MAAVGADAASLARCQHAGRKVRRVVGCQALINCVDRDSIVGLDHEPSSVTCHGAKFGRRCQLQRLGINGDESAVASEQTALGGESCTCLGEHGAVGNINQNGSAVSRCHTAVSHEGCISRQDDIRMSLHRYGSCMAVGLR